jgi:diguanylate cyclase (GGDEF)-like protein
MQITPMLIPAYAKAIGYIALGMVPVISLTLLLYAKQVFLNAKTRVLNAVTLFVMIYDIAVLLLHLLKIFDFRQSLTITLIGLIGVVVLVLLTTYWNRHYLNVSTHSKITKFFVIGLTIGLSIDLLMFFTSYGTGSLVCSLIIFILYSIAIFFSHILQMTRKVHTDPLTGLLNRQNWNEAVIESLAAKNSTTIIVLDLNSLKQINDTYGHDIGDYLIAGFATILKNSFPARSSICRWGGDEFAIMLQDTTTEQMEHILSNVERSVNTYNNTTDGPEMSYSVGYATSSDYTSASADFLFKEADKKMYCMKQEWHRTHQK